MPRAEEFAGAALMQVAVGKDETVVGLGHGLQALVLDIILVVGDEQAVGLRRAAADASAQLVQLGETESVRTLDQHDGGIRHIHTDFDDGCGNQDVVFAVAELEHDRFFFFGSHAAMQETHLELREDILRERGVVVHRGAGRRLVALVDQRIDDEGLTSVLDLRTDESVGALAFARGQNMRGNRLAACGHFIHDGEVEVAVDGQCQRARDGSGGHHQQVRMGAFAAQRGALFDAETMLFVNDGQLQVCKRDRVFDQRVGADDDFDRAVRQSLADFGLLGFRRIAHQQSHTLECRSKLLHSLLLRIRRQAVGLQSRKEVTEITKMLFRQNRSGRHDRGLRALARDHRRGQRGNDGLARTHVALQESIHRSARCEVAADVFDGAGLRAGQGEGQAA